MLELDHIQTLRDIVGDDEIVCNVSLGKDSLATLYLCKQAFKKVHCLFFTQCPGRPRDEKYMEYIQKKFNVEFFVLPHPEVVKYLNHEAYFKHSEVFDPFFEDPEHHANDKLVLPNKIKYELDEGVDYFKKRLGSPDLWTAIGIKQGDSVRRRVKLQNCGYAEPNKRRLYPITNYLTKDVYSLLKKINVKLSSDYPIYGSSFDGIALKYWVRAKRNDPQTWEWIKKTYPMAPAMIAKDRFRREMNGL